VYLEISGRWILGDVHIRVHSDSVWKLQKVKHILELKKNLSSVGQLDDEGHSIHFHGGRSTRELRFWLVVIRQVVSI
jgi:hypothetical protein